MNRHHNFKKILVPIDGSKYSEKILNRACEITKAFDSDLVLLYVVEKPLPMNFLDRNEYLKIVQNFGNTALQKANQYLLKQKIQARILLKKGNITSEINKVATKEKCDLIIVGNKGLGTVSRFLLGSTSNKLAQSSHCSLLIVK